MKKLILIIVIGSSVLSCKKQSLEEYDGLNYPDSIDSLDLDGNGRADYYIQYYQVSTLDIPVSAAAVNALIFPVDSNEILTHPDLLTFFLVETDTLESTGLSDQWKSGQTPLLSNSWDGKSWNKEWDIPTLLGKPYYLGIHLRNDEPNQLGWIKFEFDVYKGTYQIVEHHVTEAPFVLVGE